MGTIAVWIASGARATSSAASAAAALDLSEDQVLFSIAVPSSDRPRGEVRVVQRGQALVVQTVLDTRVMKQVVGRIAEKESDN